MRLIIAEKPSVARAIALMLNVNGQFKGGFTDGKTVVISYAVGHLVEYAHDTPRGISQLPVIPTPESWRLEVIPQTAEQFEVLKKLINDGRIKEIVNACDAAREGELIFQLIMKKAENKKPVLRMWIQSMTSEGLRKAYHSIKSESAYLGLAKEANCRTQSDWIVGINGSVAMTAVFERMYNTVGVTPVGRVKTYMLSLIVNRHLEIANFIKSDYWVVNADFCLKADHAQAYSGKWVNLPDGKLPDYFTAQNVQLNTADDDVDNEEIDQLKAADEESIPVEETQSQITSLAQAQEIISRCMAGDKPKPVTRLEQNKRVIHKKPPFLFDLNTLQAKANKDLKFTSAKTLEIAQALYEKHKCITYPRTDFKHLTEDSREQCKKILELLSKSSEQDYAGYAKTALDNVDQVKTRVFNNKKVGDHFGIIPTENLPTELSSDERKLYLLIVSRFKAVFLQNLQTATVERYTFIGEDAFRTLETTVIEKGWTAVEKASLKEKLPECQLPDVSNYAEVTATSIGQSKHQTQPPVYFTDGTIIIAMKYAGRKIDSETQDIKDALLKTGIGTPATKAKTLEDLIRSTTKNNTPKPPMVYRKGNKLIPTELGINLIQILMENNVRELISADFTGTWEHKLKIIQSEPEQADGFMRYTQTTTENIISSMKQLYASLPEPKLVNPCPRCNSELLIERYSVECSSACGFSVRRSLSQRIFSVYELDRLILNKRIDDLDGFISSKGQPFMASIYLDDDFNFKIELSDGKVIDTPCPNCENTLKESHKLISCTGCEFKLWKSPIAKRNLKPDEITTLLAKGTTPPLTGFISSKENGSKKFSACLVLNKETGEISLNYDTQQDMKKKCPCTDCQGTLTNDLTVIKCDTCEFKFFIKYAKKKLTATQINKLLKGETIQHAGLIEEVKDSGKYVDQLYSLSIDKANKRIKGIKLRLPV